ncbi:hypothetical protein BGX38DRAFT_1198981 [Terfezia claveryi]|nr:hypothetical protein BGX38DRAFT_1198981 [Terfezia claveryi]
MLDVCGFFFFSFSIVIVIIGDVFAEVLLIISAYYDASYGVELQYITEQYYRTSWAVTLNRGTDYTEYIYAFYIFFCRFRPSW